VSPRASVRAHGPRRPHTWKQQRAVSARFAPGRLLTFVRLSSERARQAVRQECSFAKKQESPPALLVVVLSERHALVHPHARLELVAGLPAIAAKAIVGVWFPWVAALSSVALVDVGRGY
jgi:hypothetical protein